MKIINWSVFSFILLLLFSACGGGEESKVVPPGPPTPPPVPPIASISTADLFAGFDFIGPAQERIFAKPSDAISSRAIFEGRLILNDVTTQGNITYLSGNSVVDLEHLPAFDFSFVQVDDWLVPSRRGLIVTEHSTWNYIIEPGQVWQDTDDENYARVSLPFALTPKGGNSVYNGTMLFVFDENVVSNIWYQITQETSTSAKVNMWGLLEATYQAEAVTGAADLATNFQNEQLNRFPSKSINDLAIDYPAVDLGSFGAGLSVDDRTLYGFIIDDINYTSACHTRMGDYYHCDSMRFPSYSTSKSAFAGVAMMRIAESLDPNIENLLIRDYVSEAADATGNWDNVTIGNTLDMATGNYQSSTYMIDEEQFGSHPFFTERFYAERIEAAFSWPSSAIPGSQWVYHTSDTFIATRAMQNYLVDQQVNETDIFEYVVNEVYKPINIGPGAFTSSRTRDNNWQGQAFGGYGLWWISDDIAKLTTLINVYDGVHQEQQLLNADILHASMQHNQFDRGVIINNQERYNNGFWATKYGPAEGFACEFWVTEMLGYSGIVIVMMPNGTTYYYASDNREFTWFDAVSESNKLRPFCY